MKDIRTTSEERGTGRQKNDDAYQRPLVERRVDAAELSREILYAGEPTDPV